MSLAWGDGDYADQRTRIGDDPDELFADLPDEAPLFDDFDETVAESNRIDQQRRDRDTARALTLEFRTKLRGSVPALWDEGSGDLFR